MRFVCILLLLIQPVFGEDWILIIKDGQSVSIGVAGSPVLTTTQPYNNTMFNICGTARTALVALIEPPSANPFTSCDFSVETGAASLGNTATKLSPGAAQIYVLSVNGVSGATYDILSKTSSTVNAPYGATSYNDIIDAVTKFKAAAVSAGKTARVGAIVVNHGQTDTSNAVSAATYEADMVQWQSDFNTDIKAITGQMADVPMILSQWSSWTKWVPRATPTLGVAGYDAAPATPIAIWKTAMDHYGSIYMSGPEYPYPTADGIHLTNAGYRLMGGRDGKIIDWIVRQGRKWKALAPRTITVSGTTITARFWDTSGTGLVIDTTNVTDPGCLGFEFTQTGASPPTIICGSITVSGDTVTIPLTGTTSGTVRLGYAFTGILNNFGGPTTGPRGNLRNQATTTDDHGDSEVEWAPTFLETLPFSWEPDVQGSNSLLRNVSSRGVTAR